MGRVTAIVRKYSPLGLISLSLFLLVYGAIVAGTVAFLATLLVIACAHKPRLNAARWAGAAAFVLAGVVGTPAALYNFTTESCVGAALDLSDGDVRSMSDPRLSADDRLWVERTYQAASTQWGQAGLPALKREAIANVLVNAPGYVRSVVAPGEPPRRAALGRAKEALVAMFFERRSVCHAFHGGPLLAFDGGKARRETRILRVADTGIATVGPALIASFLSGPSLAATSQSPTVATAQIAE